jgi:leucyl aminopeptidase
MDKGLGACRYPFYIHAWTPKTKPGGPEGAEVQAARLLYDLIDAR